MLKELQEKANSLLAKLQEIQSRSAGKEGGMPPEDEAEFDKCAADLDKVQADIKRAQTVASAAAFNAQITDLAITAGGRIQPPEVDGTVQLTADQTAAQFFSAIAGVIDRPLSEVQNQLGQIRAAGQATGPSSGSPLMLPMVLSERILVALEDELFMRRLSTVETLTQAESLGVIKTTETDDFEWIAENTTSSEATADINSRRELKPMRGSRLLKLSRRLLRLAADSEKLFMGKMTFSAGRTQEKAFLQGSGVGRPLGIFIASADGISTGRDVTGGTANVVGGDDLINMEATLRGVYRRNAAWIMHRNFWGRVRKLKDSNGDYIWSPLGTGIQGLTPGAAGILLGYPVYDSEFAPDPGLTGNMTTGSYPCILGDCRRGYTIVDSLQMELIPMVETYAGTNYMGYTFNFECDGAPVDEEAFARFKVA